MSEYASGNHTFHKRKCKAVKMCLDTSGHVLTQLDLTDVSSEYSCSASIDPEPITPLAWKVDIDVARINGAISYNSFCP